MDVVAGHDLRGRTVLITGGGGGLGVEATKAFASAGATVVVLARDVGRARESLASIGTPVEVEALDLTRLASVRAFAARWKDRKLDLLINNAGIMHVPFDLTEDGFEQHIGVNHLSHFLLALLLTPALEQGTSARVVSVSSGAHRVSAWNAEDPHYARRSYNPGVAYGQSKTANALFALGYDRRFRDKGIRAFSLMPGVIETPLLRHIQEDTLVGMKKMLAASIKTPEEGAATIVWAAIGHELDGHGGLYLENCAQAVPADPADMNQGVADHALDPDAADRLWDWSLRQVGLAK